MPDWFYNVPKHVIDWSQVAQNIFVAIAAILAIIGLNAWRREQIGRRRMLLAEHAIALFYQAREAMAEIRFPLVHSYEGAERPRGERETKEQVEELDFVHAFYARIQKHSKLFGRIRSMRYRFGAVFGQEKEEPFGIFEYVIRSIQQAATVFSIVRTEVKTLDVESDATKMAKFAELQHSLDEQRKILWGFPTDPLAPAIERMLLLIDETCRKEIR